jgi:monothiol glutaredoxin
MLTDVSGEEVETYLVANNMVGSIDREADSPTNQACGNESKEINIEFKQK